MPTLGRGTVAVKARELMNSDIVTLRCETELSEIYAVMLQYDQTDFPVVNGDYQLVGMLHEENILKPFFTEFRKKSGEMPNYSDFKSLMQNSEFSGVRADQMMTSDHEGIPLDLDIVRAGALMSARKTRHLAVVADGRVVGMISDSSIFLHLMSLAHDPESTAEGGLSLNQPLKKSRLSPENSANLPVGDRRKFKRMKAAIQVAYKLADTEGKVQSMAGFFCRCMNVSLGGMMLELHERLALKQLVVLAFEIPGSGIPIRRLARVSRVLPAEGCYQTGVMFLALSVDETAAMQRLLITLETES